VTWGINPGQAVGVSEKLPEISLFRPDEQDSVKLAYKHMGFSEGQAIQGTKIDVAFVGSCTNGRINDLREAARIAKGNKVASRVKALVVPGSKQVLTQILLLHRQGHTIVMTTHDLEMVIDYVDRLIVMKDGRVVKDGGPRTLIHALETFGVRAPYTARLGMEVGSWRN